MGDVDINWFAVILAALSSVGVSWLWVGVAATTVIVSDTFAQRPIQMMAISLGNRLVTLLVMGLIIGVFGV